MKKLGSILFFCSFLAFVYLPDSSKAQTSWWVNPNNPVINNGQTGEWDEGGAFLANIVFFNDTFYLAYTGSKSLYSQPTAIGFATSSDGITFTKFNANPILEGDGTGFDAFGVNQPVFTVADSTWFLYYSGHPFLILAPGPAIGMATSSNPGGPWTRLENPVLEVGSAGEWDAGFVGPNTVIKTDTGFVMYYFGGDVSTPGAVGQVGMAVSADGINWIKYDDPFTTDPPFAESDPVLQPGVPGSWDDASIYGLSVLKTEVNWEMFYSGGGLSISIGFATSSDGIHWVKYVNNPVLTPSEDPYAGFILEYPSAVLHCVNDTLYYYLYYDYGPGGGIGLAIDTSQYACTTSIEESTNTYLSNYKLLQNFPNPFNPATTIKYQIPEISFVTLKIFDILGNEIETLVNEEKSGGTYESTWNAATLPSGIYFYQLKAGSFVETKKMILLK